MRVLLPFLLKCARPLAHAYSEPPRLSLARHPLLDHWARLRIGCVLAVPAASRVAFNRDVISPRRRVCCTVRRGRCLRRRGHSAPSPRLMGTGDLLRGVSIAGACRPRSNSVLLPDRFARARARTHALRPLSRPFPRCILAAAVAQRRGATLGSHTSHRACTGVYALARGVRKHALGAGAAGLLARGTCRARARVCNDVVTDSLPPSLSLSLFLSPQLPSHAYKC